MNTQQAAATKPRIRAATPAEVAKYEAAVWPLLDMPAGEARQTAILKLRERLGIFVNYASGTKQYRAYNH
jgi:hypothetical protein